MSDNMWPHCTTWSHMENSWNSKTSIHTLYTCLSGTSREIILKEISHSLRPIRHYMAPRAEHCLRHRRGQYSNSRDHIMHIGRKLGGNSDEQEALRFVNKTGQYAVILTNGQCSLILRQTTTDIHFYWMTSMEHTNICRI